MTMGVGGACGLRRLDSTKMVLGGGKLQILWLGNKASNCQWEAAGRGGMAVVAGC